MQALAPQWLSGDAVYFPVSASPRSPHRLRGCVRAARLCLGRTEREHQFAASAVLPGSNAGRTRGPRSSWRGPGNRERAAQDTCTSRAISRLGSRCNNTCQRQSAGALLPAQREQSPQGDRRSHDRPRFRAGTRTVDRHPAEMAARARRPRLRRRARERALHLAAPVPAVHAPLLRLPPTLLDAAPRPARAAFLLDLVRVLQPRPPPRLGPARLPAAALSAGADACAARVAAACAERPDRCTCSSPRGGWRLRWCS